MVEINFKRYIIYCLRWQLSTLPIVLILVWLSMLNKWTAMAIANLICGLVFFWFDKFIIMSKYFSTKEEIEKRLTTKEEEKFWRINPKKYSLYLLRWQLTSPIMTPIIIVLSSFNEITATAIANLVGALVFFWVDKFIITTKYLEPQWQIKENAICSDCSKTARGYRLVKAVNYDKTKDPNQKFRCEECSIKKTELLKKEGVFI